jgi:PKHD-type hydroxylase
MSGDSSQLEKQVLYKKLFTPAECREIINLPGRISKSGVSDNYGGALLNSEYRNSTSKTIDYNEKYLNPAVDRIYEKVLQLAVECNEEVYGFKLSGISNLDVLHYTKDDFFKWHVDIGVGIMSRRKISLVVFLSDSAEYSGGKLKLLPSEYSLPQEQGYAAVFPSYLPHKVEDIGSGDRYTLVAWMLGPHYR